MADNSNSNDGLGQGGDNDVTLPEDLQRLLDRAESDDSDAPVYDPDAEDEAGMDDGDSDENDDVEDDDSDDQMQMGDDNRGAGDGVDVHGGRLQFHEFGHEMEQSFIEYSMSVITARQAHPVRHERGGHLPEQASQEVGVDRWRSHRQVSPAR